MDTPGQLTTGFEKRISLNLSLVYDRGKLLHIIQCNPFPLASHNISGITEISFFFCVATYFCAESMYVCKLGPILFHATTIRTELSILAPDNANTIIVNH